MNQNTLAKRFACQICQKLPMKPVCAEDGFFYHEECIRRKFEEVDKNGVVISPANRLPMGRGLIPAITIRSLIEKIVAEGKVEKKWSGDSDDHVVINEDDEFLIEEAEDGDPKSMAILGRWCLFGEKLGVMRNVKKGYKLIEEAAKLGNNHALGYKGFCLIHGLGVEIDRDDGHEDLVIAANKGATFAAYKLGCMYYAGSCGYKLDSDRGRKWLKMARELELKVENDENFSLTVVDMENIQKYLSIDTNSASNFHDIQPSDGIASEDGVPEHIHAHDHDSVSELTGNSAPRCNCCSENTKCRGGTSTSISCHHTHTISKNSS